jgi:hypothetical protein
MAFSRCVNPFFPLLGILSGGLNDTAHFLRHRRRRHHSAF